MFKDKAIQIGLVKRQPVIPTVRTSTDEHTFEDRVDHISVKLDKLGNKVILGVVAYVVLDTWRKVQIAKAGS